jgi:hypothetical protein
MRDTHAESLERLLTGDLSRDEERQLAQSALADPELFDALTAASVAKAALTSSKRPARVSPALIAALAAAAVLLIAVAYWSRGDRANPAPAPPAAATASTPAAIAPPILLTARSESAAAPTFRTDVSSSRLPKASGTIVQVQDAIADLDLGSLDGLKQGDALWIVRDGRRLGRLSITTVFRERARGRIEDGVAATTADRVEIDPVVHVNAVIELAQARRAAGDLTRARELATMASARANGPDMSPTVQQRSRVELATVLNDVGAAHIERRDLAAAEQTLRSAQSSASGPLLARITNNLGALAALRGDRAEAERLYREADSIAAGAPDLAADRAAIAKNLAALHGPR